MNGETLEGSCQKIVVDILDIVLYRAAEWKYCFRCLSLEVELMERENRKEFDIYFVIHYLDLLTIFLRIDITKYFQFVDMILKRNAQNRLLHFSAENVDNSAVRQCVTTLQLAAESQFRYIYCVWLLDTCSSGHC